MVLQVEARDWECLQLRDRRRTQFEWCLVHQAADEWLASVSEGY
ncbi:MAG TPA: hypothetical protein VFF40_08360 [Acidimicrobiia bacterium]|nr:hypothetical protein [Acidimicrobiia bacterium]